MPTKIELAWAAGLFDGEGCIHIGYVPPSKRNDLRNPSYRLSVKVTMGDKSTVERFCSIMGTGTIQNHVARNERINASYSWMAMSRKAHKSLLMLRPYLVTKSAEADVAIEFSELPDVERGGAHGSPQIDPVLLQRKHDLMVACCQLKSRYRFRKNQIPLTPEIFDTSLNVQRKKANAKNKVS